MANRVHGLVLIGAIWLASGLWGYGGEIARQTTDLSGEWLLHPMSAEQMEAPPVWPETMPTNDPVRPAATETWQLCRQPQLILLREWQGAWLARQVNLPNTLSSRRVLLEFDSLYFRCRLFVNGVDCGTYWGGFSPWRADVTHAVRPGGNLIHLSLTPAALHAKELTNTDPVIMYDNGGRKVGMFENGRMILAPDVFVNDVFVRPSVAQKALAVDVEIINTTDGEQRRRLTLIARDADGKSIKTLAPVPVRLPPQSTNTVTVTGEWARPRLWWPHDPYLYTLETRLESADGGKAAADVATTRFGFRQITVEGHRLLLNGRKIMLRGGSHVGRSADKDREKDRWVQQITRNYVNTIRTHYSPPTVAMLEAADEVGLMLLPQGPIWGEGTRGEPEFWALLSDQYLRYIKARRNHPSVVIWSVGNEAGGMKPHPTRPGGSYLAQLVRDAKALDPTRPHTCSHDFTVYGAGDLIDAPTQWGFEFDDTFPMAARAWYVYGYDFVLLYRQKPMPVSDDECMEGYNHGHASVVVGDKAYLNPIGGSDRRSYYGRWAHSWSSYMGVIEMRRQEQMATCLLFGDRYSFFTPPPDLVAAHPELAAVLERSRGEQGRLTTDPEMIEMAQKSLKPAIVAPKEWHGGAWAGRPYRRDVVIMNDNFFPLRGRLRWTVLDEKGRELTAGAVRISVPAATHQDRAIEFRMPDSRTAKSWTLRLELQGAEGRSLYRDDLALGVLPTTRWSDAPPVVVWPAEGSFASAARRAGIRHRVTADLPTDANAVVVVPRGVWLTYDQWAALQSFIERGGAALVLTDTSSPVVLGATPVRASGAGTVIAHPRVADHPLGRGIPRAALRYWVGAAGTFFSPPAGTNVPAFTISERTWAKPRRGNFWPLLDAGMVRGEMGLTQAPLLEVRHGQGRALVSSLLLAEGVNVQVPGAERLLFDALAYLGNRSLWLGGPLKPARVVGMDLSAYGVQTTERSDEAGALIIQARHPDGAAWLAEAALREEALAFAQRGGTLLLHNLTVEQVQALGSLLGIALEAAEEKVNPVRPEPTRYRLDWLEEDPVRRGLSHFEVNWCETYAQENVKAYQQIMMVGVKGPAERVKNLTQQGALVVIPHGEGRIVIDQVLWDPPPDVPILRRANLEQPWASGFRTREDGDPIFVNPYVQARAEGYVAQLLSNLDVLIRPAVARRSADGLFEPDEHTMALWHFDEVSYGVLRDSSAGSRDIVLAPPAELVEGRFGGGLRLTREGALWPQRGRALAGLPQQTFDFFIRPDGTPRQGPQCIWVQHAEGTWSHFGTMLDQEGRVIFWYDTGGRHAQLRSGEAVEGGRWTRVTIVRDHGRIKTEGGDTVNQLRMYFDGRLVAKQVVTGHLDNRGAFAIGAPKGFGMESFRGVLDEFRILDRVLPEAEIGGR